MAREERIAEKQDENAGSVWLCSQCNDVHLRWENWMVTLSREQFARMSRMAETAGRKLGDQRALQ